MNKYLYKIKDLEIPTHLKYWFTRKSKINFDLSEILNGTSFDLTDTVNKKLHLINIFGNSVQETTTGKNLLNPYLSNTTTHGVTVTYDENTQEITLNGTCDKDNTTFIFTSTPEFNLPKNNNIYGLIKYISGQSNGFFSLRAFNNNYSVSIGVNTNNPINTDIIYNRTFSVDVLFTSFSIRVDEGSTFDNLKIKLMISKVDAVYEPYTNGASPNPDYPQEIKSSGDNGYIVEKFSNSDNTQLQTYTIPCQQPMRAIGDVKDTFVKIEGVWYERHNIIRKIYDGTEKFETNLTNNGYYAYSENISNYLRVSGITCESNYFKATANGGFGIMQYGECHLRYASDNYKYFYMCTNISTVELFKEWLKEKYDNEMPVYVDYLLQEPIDLPCTQSQITALENLQKARTYKDVTHIYSDDEVPAELEIQYYKEKGE